MKDESFKTVLQRHCDYADARSYSHVNLRLVNKAAGRGGYAQTERGLIEKAVANTGHTLNRTTIY